MTVVGVALPLYVTRKILYVCVGILNSLQWRGRVIKDILLAFWLVGLLLDGWMYDQLTNQGSWQSRVKLSTWTGVICYFIDLVQPCIECEGYRQAFDHENHTTRYI